MVKILQIAVITHINRRARMHEISKQNIGVELLLGRQVSIGIERVARRIRQNGVVLQNHAQRKLRRKLPVPLAANNVVVENPLPNGSAGRSLRKRKKILVLRRPQALKQISIFDL